MSRDGPFPGGDKDQEQVDRSEQERGAGVSRDSLK